MCLCSENYISLYNLFGSCDVKTLTQTLHEPRLDTILMVETAIKQSGSYPTRKQLWTTLPKKIQYQTLCRILNYLESSNKIIFDGRRIVWIFPDNAKLQELLQNSIKL